MDSPQANVEWVLGKIVSEDRPADLSQGLGIVGEQQAMSNAELLFQYIYKQATSKLSLMQNPMNRQQVTPGQDPKSRSLEVEFRRHLDPASEDELPLSNNSSTTFALKEKLDALLYPAKSFLSTLETTTILGEKRYRKEILEETQEAKQQSAVMMDIDKRQVEMYTLDVKPRSTKLQFPLWHGDGTSLYFTTETAFPLDKEGWEEAATLDQLSPQQSLQRAIGPGVIYKSRKERWLWVIAEGVVEQPPEAQDDIRGSESLLRGKKTDGGEQKPVVRYKISCNIDKDLFKADGPEQDTTFEVELLLEPIAAGETVASGETIVPSGQLPSLNAACRLFSKIHLHTAKLIEAGGWTQE